MKKRAPVAVFAYSREDHLKITLNALNQSPLAPETDLFIFCDNYKSDKDKEAVNKVRQYIDSFARVSMFNETVIRKAEKNRGLKNSIIAGVSELMGTYGKVIVIEDDLKTSHNFLQYMNCALDYYESNPSIWAISGYSFPMKSLKNYSHDVFFTGRGCSWGWASWKDRWDSIDWEVSDYNDFKHNWKKRIEFSQWGADLPPMLDGQMKSNIDSWAVIWCYAAYKKNMLTVYPKNSFVMNIGNDGSGTHGSKLDTRYMTELEDNDDFNLVFEDPFIDNSIKKEFAKKYTGNTFLAIKDQVKSFLRRNGLYR